MGFRNRFPGKVVSRQGERATVSAGSFSVSGTVAEDLQPGASAVLAVRPDDVTLSDGTPGGVPVTVEAIEYRGREYVGIARTPDGVEIIFHADHAAAPGSTVSLSIDPARALVFTA